jgi:hypothetical protein
MHHQGAVGIHTLGKREFERLFMTQDAMLKRVDELLYQQELDDQVAIMNIGHAIK